ncbi:hypothetical protein QVD17_17094 [Tagetes erecta]|uniref:Uncharacterized protein n=1 Tax=Tagetes erecta TaxID=13708 RepID=A0AAD8KRN9_TARER|nr:hypothetical protein QVD17_17094 [Tagetes erecta]
MLLLLFYQSVHGYGKIGARVKIQISPASCHISVHHSPALDACHSNRFITPYLRSIFNPRFNSQGDIQERNVTLKKLTINEIHSREQDENQVVAQQQ